MSFKMGLLSTIALVSLAQVSVAQPHRRHNHGHLIQERAVSYVTVSPEVLVYLDAAGNTVSVETVTSTTSVAAATAVEAAATGNVVYVQVGTDDAASTTATASSAESSSKSEVTSSGLGIAYDPYAANGNCKTLAEIQADFDVITGYDLVRIYGTDCDQVANLMTVATANNFRLFAGVFDLTSLADELQTIISAANGDWSLFHTISIGNEMINSGTATVSQIVAALGTARTTLKAAGYTGNIVTVDTFNALVANPELCGASDYCAANCHAFFDGNVAAADAGAFVLEQAQRVSDAAGGKTTVITESGWPHAGQTNGKAIPSPADQATALQSLRDSFTDNLYLFSALDDLWKNPGEYDVEQSWGFLSSA